MPPKRRRGAGGPGGAARRHRPRASSPRRGWANCWTRSRETPEAKASGFRRGRQRARAAARTTARRSCRPRSSRRWPSTTCSRSRRGSRRKKKADFAAFAPWLSKRYDLKRQEAECVGYGERHIVRRAARRLRAARDDRGRAAGARRACAISSSSSSRRSLGSSKSAAQFCRAPFPVDAQEKLRQARRDGDRLRLRRRPARRLACIRSAPASRPATRA